MRHPRTGIVGLCRARVNQSRTALAAVVAIVCLLTAACGRKGPPLPPLVRVPQPIQSLDARRLGNEVFVTFTVPDQNVDAISPADVSRLDLLALTTDAPPDRADFDRLAVRVASINVAPPPPEGGREPVAKARDGDVTQGAVAALRETLSPAALLPVALPRKAPISPPSGGRGAPPDIAKDDAPAVSHGVRRYYMVVAATDRGRSSRSVLASVSMRALPPAPDNLTIEYSRDKLTLSWSAATDAIGYFVYRAAANAAAAPPPGAPAPSALNAKPEQSTTFGEGVVFGEERCYQVRAVTELDGERIEGDASAVKCETPEDTFAPVPPATLDVVAGSEGDGLTLRWSPSGDKDLGGYAVLRGRPGDATLAQIAQTPPTQTQYVDRSVSSGARYVYAVVAFDTHAPTPNRSEESPRDDGEAR